MKGKLFFLPLEDKIHISNWVKDPKTWSTCFSHLYDELVFKKLNSYRYEDEHRFIHLEEPLRDPLNVTPVKQKISCDAVGLKLVRIATSDVNRVREKFPNSKIEITGKYFSERISL